MGIEAILTIVSTSFFSAAIALFVLGRRMNGRFVEAGAIGLIGSCFGILGASFFGLGGFGFLGRLAFTIVGSGLAISIFTRTRTGNRLFPVDDVESNNSE